MLFICLTPRQNNSPFLCASTPLSFSMMCFINILGLFFLFNLNVTSGNWKLVSTLQLQKTSPKWLSQRVTRDQPRPLPSPPSKWVSKLGVNVQTLVTRADSNLLWTLSWALEFYLHYFLQRTRRVLWMLLCREGQWGSENKLAQDHTPSKWLNWDWSPDLWHQNQCVPICLAAFQKDHTGMGSDDVKSLLKWTGKPFK